MLSMYRPHLSLSVSIIPSESAYKDDIITFAFNSVALLPLFIPPFPNLEYWLISWKLMNTSPMGDPNFSMTLQFNLA